MDLQKAVRRLSATARWEGVQAGLACLQGTSSGRAVGPTTGTRISNRASLLKLTRLVPTRIKTRGF